MNFGTLEQLRAIESHGTRLADVVPDFAEPLLLFLAASYCSGSPVCDDRTDVLDENWGSAVAAPSTR